MQKTQLDAAAKQAEANRENIAAVLERLGVADFSSLPAPTPPQTPQQCSDGEGKDAPPQISADGVDIEVAACGGTVKFASKKCAVDDLCTLQTDLNNVKAMLGLDD